MTSGTRAGALLALAACVAASAAPFSCGGDAFTAGSGDAGQTIEGSVEGAIDGLADGADGAPGDGTGPGEAMPPAEAGAAIHGTVVDQFLLPMAGVDVHCQMQKATTALDGTFSIPLVTTPYVANVVVPATGGHKHGYVFEGLTRRDATLQLSGELGAAVQSTPLSGHLVTNGVVESGIVFADLPATTPAAASNTIPITVGASDYAGQIGWVGAPTASATLYALQWVTTSGAPSGYISYASAPETLVGGTAFDWPAPSNSGPGQGMLTANLAVSGGYVPAEMAVYFRPPGSLMAAPIQVDTKALTGTQVVVTPDITGSSFVACGVQVPAGTDAGASGPFGAACRAGLTKDATAALVPPTAPTFIAPPTMAGIGTTFSWQSVPNAVYLIIFAPAATSTTIGDTFFVVTTDASQTIPNLSLLGFTVPTGATYVTTVYAVAPFASIDAAVSPLGFSGYITRFGLGQGPLLDGQLAHSDYAAFMVQ